MKEAIIKLIQRYKHDAKLLEEINDDSASIFELVVLDLQELLKESANCD